MTKAGIGFIVSGVAVYLLGSQTQIGWLYLFDAMIWSIIIISAFLPWWSLKSLRIERQVLLPPSANGHYDLATPREDGTIEVRLKVRNHGHLARYFVKVMENCPLDEPSNRSRAFFLPNVKAGSEIVVSYTASCYRRGRYTSAKAVLESAVLLGLFVHRHSYDIPLNVTVYPTYYEMEAMPTSGETWADQGQRVKSSATFEFYGSREYHPGDPLRHIHWRNTARLGQFVVKQFEETTQGSMAVAFETKEDWGEEKDTTLEYSIKIAASLAKHCNDSGRSISITAGPTPLLRANWLEAMDYLAELKVGGTAGLDKLTAATEPTEALVAIVPASETHLIPCLSLLAEREERLVVVLLEDFANDEVPHEFISRLGGINLDIVRCSRGHLKGAIDTLGHSMISPNWLATLPR